MQESVQPVKINIVEVFISQSGISRTGGSGTLST